MKITTADALRFVVASADRAPTAPTIICACVGHHAVDGTLHADRLGAGFRARCARCRATITIRRRR